ncbi:hypothetical protein psyc5s11_30020 [Clostridium gelidum]|uniref:Transglycosylase n=1 Tax=Clostridium gelidum TaxID=704125 RepID=A0ABN6IXT6_9CLOT|nr:hypothetical protein [Clostridium gelidum]BCZ46935.1 hypothetical protein psyc5s11_30020 [Clostridium gelidum]
MATVKYKVVKCDECDHSFKLKPKILKTEIVGESVERSYFCCPKCTHKFIVMYQDQEFKNNLNEMEQIRSKASELRVNDLRYVRLLNEYTRLQQRNLELSKQYKKIYGS